MSVIARAVEQLATMNSERFVKILEIAQKQAETGDAADLQRLGKQLSVLKNSFQAFDVQEEFMSGSFFPRSLTEGLLRVLPVSKH